MAESLASCHRIEAAQTVVRTHPLKTMHTLLFLAGFFRTTLYKTVMITVFTRNLYWNCLPDSFSNFWSYDHAAAQALGNDTITMAVEALERQAKLRRFQELVNGDIGLIPLFSQVDHLTLREQVQGHVYYPDGIPVLTKLRLASSWEERRVGSLNQVIRRVVLMVPIVLGASAIMFVLTLLIPGDPALMRLGNFATVEQLQELRAEMGLDRRPHVRYLLYLDTAVASSGFTPAIWRDPGIMTQGERDQSLCPYTSSPAQTPYVGG